MTARDRALLVALGALWGGSFLFIRIAAPVIGALPLTFARVAIAALALTAFAALGGIRPDWRRRWRPYLVVGVVNSALPFALFSYAELTIDASAGAVLNATSPFFGMALAAFGGDEAFDRRKLAGMLLGFGGVGLLVGGMPGTLGGAELLAIAACLGAALCYAVAGVYTRRTLRGEPPLGIALASQVAAALVLAPVLPFLAPPDSPGLPVLASVLALGILSTAVAYIIYFGLIARAGASAALTVTFLIPAFGVLWGTLFLGEALEAGTLAGCALILLGTAIATRTARRPLLQTSSEAGPRT